jgi:formylglycine-generating enzyme required for sulfatase activity
MSASDDETILNSGLPQASALPAGTRLGDYEIEKLLGAGAMGQVYLARQVRLDQRCALKVLPEAFTKSADFEKRFEREGRSLAKLDNPNIVRVLYAGVAENLHFLAMEYVPGGTLEDLLEKRGGRLPEKEARRFLGEILAALAYAHGEGVIHRDLKPANILIGKNGACKLADFGLALVAGEEFLQSIVADRVPLAASGEEETLLSPEARASKRSSDAANLVGTIDYMSPEVRSGKAADARSDLFAVGVMAYRMLTGRKPSVGRSKDPSKLVPNLDPAWDDWVFLCMEDDPEERFQSAEEALETMDGIPAGNGADPVHVEQRIPEPVLTEEPFETVSEPPEVPVVPKAWDEGALKWFFLIVVAFLFLRFLPQFVTDFDHPPPIETHVTAAPQVSGKPAGVSSTQSPVIGMNWTVPDYNIEMVRIAPGSFTMGSPSSELGRDNDERQHIVTLIKGYWLGKYEVTQGQWQAVMGSNPGNFKNAGANAPVENVSWTDAMEFCRKLTDQERAAGRLPAGYAYSLPTEAQWEYACRAGSDTAFGFGNDEGSLWQYGNYCDRSNTNGVDWQDRNHDDGYDKTAPVGHYKLNAWGLYDMHGNVWEWCADWYGDYPSGAVTDPTGPTSGSCRVGRGGGWVIYATRCRSANRDSRGPGSRYYDLGFRLALRSVQ